MKDVSELDKAMMKTKMYNMFKKIGYEGSFQCLHEILVSADILLDVIIEGINNDVAKD